MSIVGAFWGVPVNLEAANVIPVLKKGSKKLPDYRPDYRLQANYRPVSLLALCSKILEKVVCEGLLQAVFLRCLFLSTALFQIVLALPT